MATGARASTITELKVSDIDFKGKTITYRHLKNKKVANIPLSPSLEKTLSWYLTLFEVEDYLFPSFYGTKSTVNGLRQGLEAYCKDRGVEPRGLHSLRHSFAREWIKSGGGAFQLQQMLCHSKLTMTQKYVRLFSEDLKDDVYQYSPLDNLKPCKQKLTKRGH